MRTNQASRAKAVYDELFNSLSAEWEKPTNPTRQKDAQNGNAFPLMFPFGDEDEKEDKSNYVKFMDGLWSDYDNALLEPISNATHGYGKVLNLLLCEYHSVFLMLKFISFFELNIWH
jgi:hypothetical protein